MSAGTTIRFEYGRDTDGQWAIWEVLSDSKGGTKRVNSAFWLPVEKMAKSMAERKAKEHPDKPSVVKVKPLPYSQKDNDELPFAF